MVSIRPEAEPVSFSSGITVRLITVCIFSAFSHFLQIPRYEYNNFSGLWAPLFKNLPRAALYGLKSDCKDPGRSAIMRARTDEEISLACKTEDTPAQTTERDNGRRGFRIQGALDFSLIGILSKSSSSLFAFDIIQYIQIRIREGIMTVRRFLPEDSKEVSALIVKTLREVNSQDYSMEYIETIILRSQPEDVLKRAEWTHFYVVCDADKIVGCGAIGPYWDHDNESCLFSIFVLPEYQGKGIGRKIIETLEQDAFFLRARRIEIPASITATPFYLKMGYTFKNGITEPDDELLIRMEKHR